MLFNRISFSYVSAANMKITICSFIVFSLIIVVTNAAPVEVENLEQRWNTFKTDHKKNYGSPEEEAKRKNIFAENVAGIDAHNKKFEEKLVTYTQGVNEFADLTVEEYSRRLGFGGKHGHSSTLV